MSDSYWKSAVAYAGDIAVAALGYTLAQTSIDAGRARLPITAYIDCLQKFEMMDWPASTDGEFGLNVPLSGSAVCKDLAQRVPGAD